MSVITVHSRRCFLTKENIAESELTLQRAGYFGKTAQQGEKMFICPIHRATLGKNWGNPTGRTECRYPGASIKPGTWNIPEHAGTFRNIPEHEKIRIIFKKKI